MLRSCDVRLVAVLCLVLLQASCATWRPALSPAADGSPAQLGYVRISRLDGSHLQLSRSRLSEDSLTGRRARWLTTERVAVPRDSIRTLERRDLSVGRTVGAVAAVFALPVLFFYFVGPVY